MKNETGNKLVGYLAGVVTACVTTIAGINLLERLTGEDLGFWLLFVVFFVALSLGALAYSKTIRYYERIQVEVSAEEIRAIEVKIEKFFQSLPFKLTMIAIASYLATRFFVWLD